LKTEALAERQQNSSRDFITKANKILGGFLVLSNIFYFIPWSIELLRTGGGPMGFGLLIIPLFVSIHAFLFTGILPFIPHAKYPQVTATLFRFGLILMFFGGLLSFFIPVIALFTLIPTIILAIFASVNPVEKSLIIVNFCGLAAIVNAAWLLTAA
jgi:hypothetical protein